jgi:hypothetical protein
MLLPPVIRPEVLMAHRRKTKYVEKTKKLSVRLIPAYYELVKQAANNEGLQISSYIVMLLVRRHILPEICLKTIKRCPVQFFNELHELQGVINNIGGNCKQLLSAMPGVAGVKGALASLQGASDAVTDALFGKSIPAGVDLERYKAGLTTIGTAFNLIVRSVNMDRPELADLPEVLAAICGSTDDLASALRGTPGSNEDPTEAALEEMRANMRKAGQTIHGRGGV